MNLVKTKIFAMLLKSKHQSKEDRDIQRLLGNDDESEPQFDVEDYIATAYIDKDDISIVYETKNSDQWMLITKQGDEVKIPASSVKDLI